MKRETIEHFFEAVEELWCDKSDLEDSYDELKLQYDDLRDQLVQREREIDDLCKQVESLNTFIEALTGHS